MIDLSWCVGGEAGYGIATAGYLFSKICMKHGLNVYGSREYPSLIRGGHNTFSVRLSDKELTSQSKHCKILAALNERTIKEEAQDLTGDGVIIHDKELRPKVAKKMIPVPIKEIAKKYGHPKIMQNTVVLGASASLLGFRKEVCHSIIKKHFKKKGQEIIDSNIKAFDEGYSYVNEGVMIKLENKKPLKKMLINGNGAFAIGAIRAGCNFISAYPMTPATGILEYLCSKAKNYGILALQAEDEISSINTALGASFAGARAMTCTSGGGFALMNEGLSLGGMSEAPIVIAMSQRPGPATGLPTRTGQGDLLFVLNAGHGEFTRIVLAPGDAKECYEMALDAFNYADKYQTPVIVLMDKHVSVSTKSVKPFKDKFKLDRGKIVTKPGKALEQGHRFKRYEYTKNGVSPRPMPGIKGLTYCFAGDEHDDEGFVVEDADKAVRIADKRKRKHELIKKGLKKGVKVYGSGKTTLVAWGSTKGAILEAIKSLKSEGINARLVQVKILSPFPVKEFNKNVKGKVIVIENNRDSQLGKLIKQHTSIDFKTINKYDGRPLHPEEIIKGVKKL